MKRISLWIGRIACVPQLVSLAGITQTILYLLCRAFGRGTVKLRVKGLAHPLVLRVYDSDFKVLRTVFFEREFDLAGVLPHDVVQRPMRFIIDGGANVGYSSVYFAKVHPQARIVAVEPASKNYRLLLENTRPYPNVEPLRAGLWPTATNLVLSNPEVPSWGFKMNEADGTVPEESVCPGITIAELLARSGFDRIDLLKLDIEGAEELLFETGTEAWLGRVGLLIIEVHTSAADQLVRRVCAEYGFSQCRRGEKLVFYKQ